MTSTQVVSLLSSTLSLTHDSSTEHGDSGDNHTQLTPTNNDQRAPMTSRNPSKNIWRITAVFFYQITQGYNDATPGALLPYIEQYYGLTYTLVSLIWMANALGFIFIALGSSKIQPWLGREKSYLIGNCLSIVMYCIVLSGTAFPAIVAAFFIGGCGLAIVNAQANVFLTRLDKLSKYLSLCHASYGIGGTISPLIATSMASAGVPWHYFYLILLGMMIGNCLLYYFAFKKADTDLVPWDYDEDEPVGGSIPEEQNIGLRPLNGSGSDNGADITSRAKSGKLLEAITLPNTWLLAFFVLFYQGSEVSLAGWIVTFLLDYRNGPASVGYVASGFWAGLTIGRLVLTRPMDVKFGARRSITVVSMISLVLVGLCWAIPHTIAVGVLVCVAGFFIGPNYPLMISVCGDLIPRKVQVISLTIITAFGSSGGALFPFFTGLMSEKFGPYVVMPVFLVLYALMVVTWLWLPNRHRKEQSDLTWLQKIW